MSTKTDTTIHTDGMVTRDADARTILNQIGTLTLMSLGARETVDLGCGVRFNVGRGKSRKAIVKLAANDTYSVEFVRLRRDFTAVSEFFAEDVYCDMLAEVLLVGADKAYG
jgi:hypothetical protein